MKPLFEGWCPVLVKAEYADGAWGDVETIAEQNLRVHPGSMAIQFGASAFEGYKVFKTQNGYNSFRLDENFRRFESTCARMCIPCPSFQIYTRALELICQQDDVLDEPFISDWLYLRPVVFATDSHIMPVISTRYVFAVMAAPIREYSGSGFNLWVENRFGRACEGGLGFAKTGANYAHQLLPSKIAKEHGCDSVLWLDAKEHKYIEEGNTMNVFFKIGDEIHTPELTDTILPGITRKSVISLLTQRGYKVVERRISVDEIPPLVASGQLKEMFITATALGVGKVSSLLHNGQSYFVSPEEHTVNAIKEQLKNIYVHGTPDSLNWHTATYGNGRTICLAS